MSDLTDKTIASIVDELHVGNLFAYHISDNLDWGQGDIRPQLSFIGRAGQKALLKSVLECIEPVNIQELSYSACTDGRMPVRLLDGSKIVPVREQMAGADIVSAFYIAEVLGANFYENANAPVAERVQDVALYLHENGLIASSHLGCGAATNFIAIANNVTKFIGNLSYITRLKTLLPDGIYDEQLHTEIVEAIKKRIEAEVYKDLSLQTFLDAVEKVSGKHAIAELCDDGRGIHGHVEEQIIRLRLPGHAINETKLSQITAGREVFGINDNRIERIAHLFGRGNDRDYRMAHMALEDFVDSTHASLAKDLPTYIVEPVVS